MEYFGLPKSNRRVKRDSGVTVSNAVTVVGRGSRGQGQGLADAATVGGVVFSVANSDGTILVSPTTGAVTLALNLAQVNVWLADLKLGVAGNGLYVKEGTNATMGRAVLVGGTKVVSTTKVTANSEIFLTSNVAGGTVGSLSVSARTVGISFTILSSSGTDTSTVSWLIMEPA